VRLVRLEAFLTGLALAQLQVSIGFVAMRGIGASATTWFAILFCWLLGGLLGVLWQRHRPTNQHRETALTWVALSLLWGAELAALLTPFSLLPRLLVALAALSAGAYGGAFLASRGSQGHSVAPLFFHENNGFLFGFLTASGLLLFAAPLLLPATTVLLLAARASRPRVGARPLLFPIILGISSTSFQLLFAWGAEPAWDALMTASVLTHPTAVSLGDWLFFAHPLVIPLTAPFRLLCSDPLQAVQLREAVCHGGVITLLCLSARALCPDRKQGLLVALFACLQVLFAVGRWQLAQAGEEKEITLLIGSAFLIFYLDHRGLWSLGIGAFTERSIRCRRLILGVLLAFAVTVHLLNGLLVLWLLGDLLLTGISGGERRQVAKEIRSILLWTSALLGPFFLWLAIGVGGARSPQQVLRFFLEYHLSGEFWTVPRSLPDRLLDCYRGLRMWLLGDLPLRHPVLESATVFGVLVVLLRSAVLAAPQVAMRLLAWVILLLLHFFFFNPSDPESWAPAALCGSLLVALGVLGMGRLLLLRRTLAVLWIGGLALLLGRDQRQGVLTAEQVRDFISAERASPMPLRELVRWLDVNLEPDAEIVVTDRLLVSLFQLYSARTPLVREYLGISPAELRNTHHLTTLSLRFYLPSRTPEQLNAEIVAGRPVYLLSVDQDPAQAASLPWGGLQISRISSPLGFPPAATQGHASVRPVSAQSARADLLADDLQLQAVTMINPTVYKLSLRRGEREFAAKWKPLGSEASEEQEGFDGNNSPRCELAARRIDSWLSDGDSRRQLVPEVVLRAFHREVPCERSCRGVPRLMGAAVPATFPKQNDHLVLGALSLWVENAERPTRFHDGLWNPQRFESDSAYRRSFSDLVTFLLLIAHGDANYADNFLVSEGPPFRVYSIDNGRSLDGVPYFTDEADPDWQPFAQLSPQSLLLPALSRQTLARLGQLSESTLPQQLYLVGAVDLASGRALAQPSEEPLLADLLGKPLAGQPGLRKLSRQSYLTTEPRHGGPWLLLGVSQSGVADVQRRARALLDYQKAAGLRLFE
jgi:hypothetical protein